MMAAAQRAPGADAAHGAHLPVLDGWRGISIVLVLAAHLLPLGPKAWKLNYSAGILGMALFFTLSGFLITSLLLHDPHVPRFLIRRGARIVPLAWLYCVVALVLSGAGALAWPAHFLFYANLPPSQLLPLTLHLWSLCLEMQFYAGIALLVTAWRQRGLWLLPLLCLLFSALRARLGIYASDISYYRVDEILAGCTLALVVHERWGGALRVQLARMPQWPLLAMLVLSCLPQGGWLNYLRPYFAAILVGATIVAPHTGLVKRLGHPVLLYLALSSYALYVLHPMLSASWLGSGDPVEKYAKRPLLLLVLFALAHLSTGYFERWFIERARVSAGRRGRRATPCAAAVATLPEQSPCRREHDGA
jgi:peptidoglycan/LPS O-acetylase OafA/YrhL